MAIPRCYHFFVGGLHKLSYFNKIWARKAKRPDLEQGQKGGNSLYPESKRYPQYFTA